MYYYVKYDVLNNTHYAGPYTNFEVSEQHDDIAGYEGVTNVSVQEAITFYRLKDSFGFCSNFWRAKMFVDGKWWDTVEHLYQAAKTFNSKEIDEIWKADSPMKARNLGQKVALRADWEDVKYLAMKQCLLLKFTQHHDLLQQLLDTGDKILVEDSPIDSYWGWGADHKGKNMLGKGLMEIRKELSGFNGY